MKRALTSAFAALAFSLAASPAVHAQTVANSFLLGSPVAAGSAERVITLTGETRWVNVKYGESVRFVSGTQEFAWKFDGPDSREVELRQVAPAGAVSQPITVYVTPRSGRQ